MKATNELFSLEQKLKLCERANEVYKGQFSEMMNHYYWLKQLIKEKENIMLNIKLRYKFGTLKKHQSQTPLKAPQLSLNELFNFYTPAGFAVESLMQKYFTDVNVDIKELGMKAEGMAIETLRQNIQLRYNLLQLWDKFSIKPVTNITKKQLIYDQVEKNIEEVFHKYAVEIRGLLNQINNTYLRCETTYSDKLDKFPDTPAGRFCLAQKLNELYRVALRAIQPSLNSLRINVYNTDAEIKKLIWEFDGYIMKGNKIFLSEDDLQQWCWKRCGIATTVCSTNVVFKRLKTTQYRDKLLVFGYIKMYEWLCAKYIPLLIGELILCFETSWIDCPRYDKMCDERMLFEEYVIHCKFN
eukprot:451235_1